MKRITAWLALAAGLSCILAAQAADKDSPRVIRDYTDSVVPADQQAYEAGIKAYNQCLAGHSFKYAWTAVNHETGDVYLYSYVTDPLAWKDFDAMRTAGKPCDATFRSSVNPHLKGETSSFMKVMPELSHMPKGMDLGRGYIEIVFFALKHGHEAHEAFEDAAKKLAAAADKSKWQSPYQLMQVVDGGEDAPDYVLVSPSKSWADFGMEPNPSFWKMVSNVYGEDQAKALRKTVNDAVRHTSSHVDSYNAGLSYKPSGN